MASIIILSVSLIYYILVVVADWMMFKKAGEPGFKSLIPIYNLYILCRFSWEGCKFWSIVLWSVLISVGNMFSENLIGAMLVSIGGIMLTIDSLRLNYYIAKSFGHGFGYGIGLFFLPNLFGILIGLGKEKYCGNGYKLAHQA